MMSWTEHVARIEDTQMRTKF